MTAYTSIKVDLIQNWLCNFHYTHSTKIWRLKIAKYKKIYLIKLFSSYWNAYIN